MKPKVCHISTVHSLSDNRIFHKECKSLVAAGFNVSLVITHNKHETIDGVKIIPLKEHKGRLARMTLGTLQALRLALKQKADIYHYHDPELMLAGFILRWFFFKKVVFDIHESIRRQILYKGWIPKPLRPILSFVYRIMEKVLTVGQRLIIVIGHYADDYGHKACVIHNYPRLTNEFAQAVSKADPPLLIYVGDVSEIRGATTYIDMAAVLKKEGYRFQLKIIGHYYDQDYLDFLNEKIAQNGLSECVNLAGKMDNPQAMEQVAKASIGLCLLHPVPNYKVSLSTKILEYMMFGVPVVCSDFECWRRYVADEGSGMMVDPLDLTQVVKACKAILDDPEKAAQMGRAGRLAILHKYNWDSEFQKLLTCYQSMCQS